MEIEPQDVPTPWSSGRELSVPVVALTASVPGGMGMERSMEGQVAEPYGWFIQMGVSDGKKWEFRLERCFSIHRIFGDFCAGSHVFF